MHVEPRGQVVAGAGDDDGADGAVAGELGEEGAEVVPHAVGEGVEAGGPVDEDEVDVRGGVGDEVVWVVGVGGEGHGRGMCVSGGGGGVGAGWW